MSHSSVSYKSNHNRHYKSVFVKIMMAFYPSLTETKQATGKNAATPEKSLFDPK